MKFFNTKVVVVIVVALAFIWTAFASPPPQPKAQVDQFQECVGFVIILNGQEEKQPTCPEDWQNYKREYVRTITE